MFKEKEIIEKINDLSKLTLNHSAILTEIKNDIQRLKTLWELEDPKPEPAVDPNTETWKKCKTKTMSRYLISNFGRIKSPRGIVLTPVVGKKRNGTPRSDIRVNVKVNGRFTTRRLDKLIAETYFNIDPDYEFDVIHKDGDLWNNKIENLTVLIK